MNFYEKYYNQLIGFMIVKVSFEEGPFDMEFFPVLLLRNKDGETLKLTLSSDEEGNGAGFAFIEEVLEGV
jgi:hypothetical protein